MSRSFRKYPLVKSRESGKFAKKMTNRKVRRDKNFSANHCSYKRLYDSLEIKDYCFVETLQQVINHWEQCEQARLNGHQSRWFYDDDLPTLDEVIANWKISYKCK